MWRASSMPVMGHEVRAQRVSGARKETGALAAKIPHFVSERRRSGCLVCLFQGESAEAVSEALTVALRTLSPRRRVVVELRPKCGPAARKNTLGLQNALRR